MSLRMLTWAWDDAPVDNPSDLLVLLALADEANDQGGDCWPSMRRVARRARLSVGAVHKAIGRLEAAGLVTVERPKIAAPGKSNRYTLVTQRRDSCSPHEQSTDAPRDPTVHEVNSSGENCSRPFTPERTELFTTVHPGVNVPIDPTTDPPARDPDPTFLPGSGLVAPIARLDGGWAAKDPEVPTHIGDARRRLRSRTS